MNLKQIIKYLDEIKKLGYNQITLENDYGKKEYKIVVTGPTTLGAILNSLQMGFRTLAIQKRTGEVWTVLGAVKTEFSKFGGLLEKVQKNLQSAGDQLEEVMGKRTRAIERKLRQVEQLPHEESQKILPIADDGDDE